MWRIMQQQRGRPSTYEQVGELHGTGPRALAWLIDYCTDRGEHAQYLADKDPSGRITYDVWTLNEDASVGPYYIIEHVGEGE